jgi:hypothetical protein
MTLFRGTEIYHRAFARPLMQIKGTDDNRNTRPGVAQFCSTKKPDPGRRSQARGHLQTDH